MTKRAAGAASRLIDERIRLLGGWRAETLAEVRRLIHEADPDIVEECKWIKPSNPSGVSVWSHAGIVCTGGADWPSPPACRALCSAGLSHRGLALARRLPIGSVLFVCIGSTIGKCGLAGTELATNQQINAALPSPGLDSEFLYYILANAASIIKGQAAEQAVPTTRGG